MPICQQCSCCAYHKKKPGIAATAISIRLGTVHLSGHASNVAAAHTRKQSLAMLPRFNNPFGTVQSSKKVSNAAAAHTKEKYELTYSEAGAPNGQTNSKASLFAKAGCQLAADSN